MKYHLSFWSLLVGALIVLYSQDILDRRALALPSIITFFIGLLYFRTRRWKYLAQPILFGFFVSAKHLKFSFTLYSHDKNDKNDRFFINF